MIATGEFDVELVAQSDSEFEAGRILINKSYRGDLVGKGKGQMLSKRTEVQGSAGYVAIEHVVGSLDGKSGSFTLQHSGLMNKGEQTLTIVIIPDSGDGGLKGISGTLDILVEDDKHCYQLDYQWKCK